MSPSTGIITSIIDSTGRPLVILRRTLNGSMLYILRRYKNMTENDKSVVRAAYKIASLNAVGGAELKTEVTNIEDFLSFLDNGLCG